VRQFLKIVQILPWDAEAADWHAEIRHQLVSSGHPIGEMDMMIAAPSSPASAAPRCARGDERRGWLDGSVEPAR
jgi:hypothetical protein